ncbi:MAG TPA: terminase large subunit [Candidatus Limnocylindrales bacterium]|nr:terminase large subunit [Candidatus Limnocylindrales bacterium]
MPKPVLQNETLNREPKLLPFGEKAHEFVFRDPAKDKRVTILEGSVRSSKTWQLIVKIVLLCKYRVAGQRIIVGVSKEVIKANLLNDLFEIVGEKNYDYNSQSGELRLFDTRWRVIGANDEGSERRLRGATVGIAITDELTKLPRSFLLMLFSRLSPPGARWYASTNPDSPYHYVKADIIDDPAKAKYLEVIHFELDDNPNLTEEFKEFVRASHVGVWHQRFVLGLWVVAEGAIYRDAFTDATLYDDDSRPAGLLSRGGHVERWIPIDVGTVNAFAALDAYDDGETIWIERELYWDSRKEARQKTNGEYADMLIKGHGEAWPALSADSREWPGAIVDPSAASFKLELATRGMYVSDGENDVLEGIRKVSTMLSRRRLRVHKRCVNTIREMQTYSWDSKRSDKGVEQPIKAHDHAADAIRYLVSTRIGDWRLAA